MLSSARVASELVPNCAWSMNFCTAVRAIEGLAVSSHQLPPTRCSEKLWRTCTVLSSLGSVVPGGRRWSRTQMRRADVVQMCRALFQWAFSVASPCAAPPYTADGCAVGNGLCAPELLQSSGRPPSAQWYERKGSALTKPRELT